MIWSRRQSYTGDLPPACQTLAAAKWLSPFAASTECMLQLAFTVLSIDRDTYERFFHLAYPSLRSEALKVGLLPAARAATC